MPLDLCAPVRPWLSLGLAPPRGLGESWTLWHVLQSLSPDAAVVPGDDLAAFRDVVTALSPRLPAAVTAELSAPGLGRAEELAEAGAGLFLIPSNTSAKVMTSLAKLRPVAMRFAAAEAENLDPLRIAADAGVVGLVVRSERAADFLHLRDRCVRARIDLPLTAAVPSDLRSAQTLLRAGQTALHVDMAEGLSALLAFAQGVDSASRFSEP